MDGVDMSAVLRRVAMFDVLPAAQFAMLISHMGEHHFRAGDTIFRQGDDGGCLYIIAYGKVRIYLEGTDGREITLALYTAGMSFGEFSLLDGEPRSASCAAVDDVVTGVLYRDQFFSLLEQDFEMVKHVLALLTSRIRYTTNYSEQLAFLTAPQRIAALLVKIANMEDTTHDPPRLFLTQGELAAFANTSREWVNKALRAFTNQGFIRREGGAIVVLDRSGLIRQLS